MSRDTGIDGDRTLPKRFWAKVERHGPHECWPWIGSRHPKGYGHIRVGGKYGVILVASRVAYHLARGKIPAGLQVCHTCDNPTCCNPSHLWAGTNAENVADMRRKGRSVDPSGDVPAERRARGERDGNSKLTEPQVLAIRADERSSTIVAKDYRVHPSLVRYIRARKIWRHI